MPQAVPGRRGGGALGLCLGELAHGRGWPAVLLLVAVAGVSALLTGVGATVSITGLQLLVYAILGTGPLGGLRPWWWPPLLLLAGVAWSIVLLIPGWLVFPLAAERAAVAAVYDALAGLLRAAGLPQFPQAHQAVVTALNVAWDALASGRLSSAGRDPDLVRLAALLSQTHALTEAAVTLVEEGVRPPPEVIAEIEALARAVRGDGPPPGPPPPAGEAPGARVMTEALAGAVDLLAGKRRPDGTDALHRPPLRERARDALDQTVGGRLTRIFALRVMISMGVAAVVSQALPLQRPGEDRAEVRRSTSATVSSTQ